VITVAFRSSFAGRTGSNYSSPKPGRRFPNRSWQTFSEAEEMVEDNGLKPASEIDPADVGACQRCGLLLWTPALRPKKFFLFPERVYCPQCDAVLMEKDQ
jgi:hypothetical protein